MTRLLRALTVASLGVLTACTESIDAPTWPTLLELSTISFSGSLTIGAARFYSFTVREAGSMTATLASVTLPSGAAVPTVMGLGIGIPRGTGCGLTTRVDTAARLTSQLESPVSPGIYCVEVADVGNLTGPVNFAVRFSHP